MKTVVLLAFLVSSVAFSSEHEHSKLKNRCEKLFDSKKIVTCFEGKWSRGVSASPEDFYRKCFMLVSAYFQCKITSLQDRVEVIEKRHGDELERRIRDELERSRIGDELERRIRDELERRIREAIEKHSRKPQRFK